MRKLTLLVLLTCAFMMVCTSAFAVNVGTVGALRGALVNGARIDLTADIKLDYQLLIYQLNDVVINGNGHRIYADDTFGITVQQHISHPRQLVNIVCSTVTFENVTIESGPLNSHVLNVASLTRDTGGSDVTLDNVTLIRGTSEVGGAAIIINNSRVIVKDNFTVTTTAAPNTWYAIGISNWGSETVDATLTFDSSADVTWNTGTTTKVVDAQGETDTVIGWDTNPNVGLSPNPDGTFGPAIQVTSITVDPEHVSLFVGQTEQLEVVVLPADTTFPNPLFESADDAIASVDDAGLITAHAPGSTVVYVTAGLEVVEVPVDVYEKAMVTLNPNLESIGLPAASAADLVDATFPAPVGLPLSWFEWEDTAVDAKGPNLQPPPGYRFLGWFTQPVGGVQWNWQTDVVTGDMTLYAHWAVDVPATGDDTDTSPLWWILGAGLLVAIAALIWWFLNRNKEDDETALVDVGPVEDAIQPVAEEVDAAEVDDDDLGDIDLV